MIIIMNKINNLAPEDKIDITKAWISQTQAS